MEKLKLRFLRSLEEHEDGYEVNEYDKGVFCGYNLPKTPGIKFDVWAEARFDDLYGKVYRLFIWDESVPSEREMAKYVETIPGLSSKEREILSKLEFDSLKNPEEIKRLTGFSRKLSYEISANVAGRTCYKKEFQLMRNMEEVERLKVCLEHENVLQILTQNPYSILEFPDADEVAKLCNIGDAEERFESALLYTLKAGPYGYGPFKDYDYPECILEKLHGELYLTAQRGWLGLYPGGVTLPLDVAYLGWMKALGKFYERRVFLKTVANAEVVVYRDKKNNAFLYDKTFYSYETKAGKIISNLLGEFDTDAYSVIEESEAELGIKLSIEQVDAVNMALTNTVSVITGGPGTGKSSVTSVIIDAFKRISCEEVLLISPTGKAAKRLTEVTKLPAFTIHKALGIGWDYREEGSDITAGLVIVDESSMIDSFLLYNLVSKVKKGSRLVFIGDTDQLPSVGPGAVLKSLIESRVPSKRLTITFRQVGESNVADNAAKIRIGDPNIVIADDCQFVETDHIQDDCCKEYVKMVKAYGLDNVCCLSSFKRYTDTGTNRLNEALRGAVRGDLEGVPYKKMEDFTVYEGDRVMFTQNKLGLVNGDIGTVLQIKGRSILCEFNGKEVLLNEDNLEYLELAYALTVHKSQGSEYPAVLLVMDNKHDKMLIRNLVYTAVTRAKKALVIVGEREAFNKAVVTPDPSFRESKLSQMIGEA